MMLRYSIGLFLFLLCSFYCSAQDTREADSLKKILAPVKNDSTKAYMLDDIAKAYTEVIPDSAIACASRSLAISKRIKDQKLQIYAMLTLGVTYRSRGEYETSLGYLLNALSIYQNLKVKTKQLEAIYNALNLTYTEQGNYTAGIEYGFKMLHEIEKKKDTLSMALGNNNIANTYFQIKQYDKAMKHYKIALVYAKQVHHIYGQSLLTTNIGSVFYEMGKLDSAKSYFDQALILTRKAEDESGEAIVYGNLGSYYQHLHDNATAIEYFKKAEKIFSEMKMYPNLSDSYYNLATSYLELKNYSLSLEYAKKSLELADQIGSYPHKEQAHLALSNAFEKTNNIPQSFSHYKEYIAARDSIYNEKNKKDQFKAEVEYEYSKKRYTDSLDHMLTAKIQQEALTHEREKTQEQRKLTYLAVAGFMLMLVLAGFIFKSYRDKQKSNLIISSQKEKVEIQKQEIEHQKAILETKNKEVTDSITYAKRLQEAILPPASFVAHYFPESFILFRPKDIVAGDFYWFEEMNGLILFAAADCTGHGVPGAMVSVVCSNALNRAVKEFGITEPGKILDKTRELVVETFEKSISEVKDGMDISLCAYNPVTKELKWAGANNPLWIARKKESSGEEKELKEYKATKQPIGKVDDPSPFVTHIIQLKEGESIYLFSDGYADQFGGTKGKKFKYSQIKELLLSNEHLPMQEQFSFLDQRLNSWRGNLEQVDDILIIGIRI